MALGEPATGIAAPPSGSRHGADASERERALREVTQALAAHLDEQRVLQLAVGHASELLSAPYARIWLLAGDHLQCVAAEGYAGTWSFGDHLSLGSVTGLVAAGEVLNLANAAEHPRWQQPHFSRRTGLYAYLGVPIRRAGVRLGALVVMRERAAAFDREEETLLAGLADTVAVAVDNARLYRAARDELAERERAVAALHRRDTILAAVVAAAERLLRTDDWQASATAVLAQLGAASGASRAYVFDVRPGERGDVLTSQRFEWTAPGIPPEIDNPALQDLPLTTTGFGRWQETLGRGDPICGLVAEFPSSERALLRAQGIRALVVVPIFVGQQWWGFIGFDECVANREWSPVEVDALRVAADTLGAAIQRTELEQQRLQLANEQAARAQAEAAVRQRDEFLTVAAHELKTPVTSLRGHAQLALRRLRRHGRLDFDQVWRAFEAIDRQSERLSRLISQLLDVSRIQAGRLSLDRRVTNLADLVHGAVEAAKLRTSLHTFHVSGPPFVPALVDALRLEQVLTNLLDNAIKFSPDGGRIDVGLAILGSGAISITVRDRGIGIPPEHLERIFERFYQVHAARHFAGTTGMGLGLYVSQQIAELHGGRLAAEPCVGGGTELALTLPADAPATP